MLYSVKRLIVFSCSLATDFNNCYDISFDFFADLSSLFFVFEIFENVDHLLYKLHSVIQIVFSVFFFTDTFIPMICKEDPILLRIICRYTLRTVIVEG